MLSLGISLVGLAFRPTLYMTWHMLSVSRFRVQIMNVVTCSMTRGHSLLKTYKRLSISVLGFLLIKPISYLT